MIKLIRFLLSSLIIASFVLLNGCASSKITIDEAYKILKPVKQLELPEQVDNNLVIVLENVADEGSSYKNRIDLFINDKKVQPDWAVSNVEKTYTFKLKVKPGYYKVRADYYAYVGWGEDKFPIEIDDLVRVTHDARTIVKCNIAKEPNGEPVNKKMYFKIESKPFDFQQTKTIQSTISAKPNRPQVKRLRKRPIPVEEPQPPVKIRPKKNSVVLQINTIPEKTKIILDDKLVGQSPLRIVADRTTDHVLKLAASGYKTSIKYLDQAIFGDEEIIHIVQELEREQ